MTPASGIGIQARPMFRPSVDTRHDLAVGGLLVLLLCSAAAVYHPGLSGPFLFDDFGNILNNPRVLIDDLSPGSLRQAALSGNAGPIKRPIAMLSFGLNHVFSALDTSRWKLTNLAIHLFNGLLVFLVMRRLLTLHGRGYGGRVADWVALAVTAIWLVHPVLLSSVLYVVQRMTSLASMFVLLGLRCYLGARASQMAGRPALVRLFVVVPACTVLAALAKESGALLPFFAFAIESSLLRFRVAGVVPHRSLGLFYILTVFAPLVGFAVFAGLHPGWLEWAGVGRDFSVLERLMTEARVLFFYLKILVIPALPDLALYHDDIIVSRGLFSPPGTVVAITALLFLPALAFVLRARLPFFAFAVFWFLAAHAMESTVLMLELVHVHRNYLAYIGPIGGLVVGVAHLFKDRKTLAVGGLSALFVGFALITAQRASQWSDAARMAQFEVYHHPDSPRANYEIGRLYAIAYEDDQKDEYFERARLYLSRAGELLPQNIGPPIGLVILSFNAGKRPEPALIADIESRLRNNRAIALQLPYLEGLVDCQKLGACKLPPERVLTMIGLALDNDIDNPAVKSRILLALGSYYAYLGDLEACVRVIEDAHGFVPTQPGPLISLVQAYILTARVDKAAAALGRARSADRFGLYTDDLRSFERSIEAMRARRPGPATSVGDDEE